MIDGTVWTIIRILPDGSPLTLNGRLAWALLALIDAGEVGCTPLDQPGPRWSGYIHKLRTKYGLTIETVTEAHAGPFPGHHARYILRSEVEVLHRSDGPERRFAA